MSSWFDCFRSKHLGDHQFPEEFSDYLKRSIKNQDPKQTALALRVSAQADVAVGSFLKWATSSLKNNAKGIEFVKLVLADDCLSAQTAVKITNRVVDQFPGSKLAQIEAVYLFAIDQPSEEYRALRSERIARLVNDEQLSGSDFQEVITKLVRLNRVEEVDQLLSRLLPDKQGVAYAYVFSLFHRLPCRDIVMSCLKRLESCPLDVQKIALAPIESSARNVLHIAAIKGDVGILNQLLKFEECQEDIWVLDNGHNSPLHLAAGEGHLSFLKLLLRNFPAARKALTEENETEKSPIDLAIFRGRDKVLSFFFKRYPRKTNERLENSLPSRFQDWVNAPTESNSRILAVLLDLASTDVKGKICSPEMISILAEGDDSQPLEVVFTYIDQRDDVYPLKENGIRFSDANLESFGGLFNELCRNNHFSILDAFLDTAPEAIMDFLFRADVSGKVPLSEGLNVALEEGNDDVVNMLLGWSTPELKRDFYATDPSPLWKAIDTNDLEMTQTLLYRIDNRELYHLLIRPREGQPPLHESLNRGGVEIARALLTYMAEEGYLFDSNLPIVEIFSHAFYLNVPLVFKSLLEVPGPTVIEALFQVIAGFNAPILCMLADRGQGEIIGHLLKFKREHPQMSHSFYQHAVGFQSALHVAVVKQSREVVQALLTSATAEEMHHFTFRDLAGMSPMDYALINRNTDIAIFIWEQMVGILMPRGGVSLNNLMKEWVEAASGGDREGIFKEKMKQILREQASSSGVLDVLNAIARVGDFRHVLKQVLDDPEFSLSEFTEEESMQVDPMLAPILPPSHVIAIVDALVVSNPQLLSHSFMPAELWIDQQNDAGVVIGGAFHSTSIPFSRLFEYLYFQHFPMLMQQEDEYFKSEIERKIKGMIASVPPTFLALAIRSGVLANSDQMMELMVSMTPYLSEDQWNVIIPVFSPQQLRQFSEKMLHERQLPLHRTTPDQKAAIIPLLNSKKWEKLWNERFQEVFVENPGDSINEFFTAISEFKMKLECTRSNLDKIEEGLMVNSDRHTKEIQGKCSKIQRMLTNLNDRINEIEELVPATPEEFEDPWTSFAMQSPVALVGSAKAIECLKKICAEVEGDARAQAIETLRGLPRKSLELAWIDASSLRRYQPDAQGHFLAEHSLRHPRTMLELPAVDACDYLPALNEARALLKRDVDAFFEKCAPVLQALRDYALNPTPATEGRAKELSAKM